MPCRWEKQGFSSGEDCVSKMTGQVDDPEAFCYGPAEGIKGRKIPEILQQYKNAGILFLFGSAPKLLEGNKISGRAIHPVVSFHPNEFPHLRKYVAEHLAKGVGYSSFPLPIVMDHSISLNFDDNKIHTLRWNPQTLEVEYEGEVDDKTAEQIRSGQIKNVSVEINFIPDIGGIKFMDGTATTPYAVPYGFRYSAVSLLKYMSPGDPTTNVKVWEEAVTPTAQEFFIYWIEDPAGYIQERFSARWIDEENGIQAIYGLKIDRPETPTPIALLFMRAKNWDRTKVDAWMQVHPEVAKPTEPVGIREGVSFAEAEKDDKFGLEERLEWGLLKDRTIIFHGEVYEAICKQAARRLEFLGKESKKPIHVILNSVGGGVYDGLLVFDTIKSLTNKGVSVICEARGLAASMGSIILQAGTKRLATPHTRFLIHEVSSMTWGETTKLEERTEELRKLNNMLNQIYAERTGKTVEEINKLTKKTDYWMSAKEALDFGLIDEIVSPSSKILKPTSGITSSQVRGVKMGVVTRDGVQVFCPECDGTDLRLGNGELHCNECGHTWTKEPGQYLIGEEAETVLWGEPWRHSQSREVIKMKKTGKGMKESPDAIDEFMSARGIDPSEKRFATFHGREFPMTFRELCQELEAGTEYGPSLEELYAEWQTMEVGAGPGGYFGRKRKRLPALKIGSYVSLALLREMGFKEQDQVQQAECVYNGILAGKSDEEVAEECGVMVEVVTQMRKMEFGEAVKKHLQQQGEEAPPEVQKDEHGCVVGKEIWDEEKGACVPLPPRPPETPTERPTIGEQGERWAGEPGEKCPSCGSQWISEENGIFVCNECGTRFDYENNIIQEATSPTTKEECESQGGTWDEESGTCKLPEKPETPVLEESKKKALQRLKESPGSECPHCGSTDTEPAGAPAPEGSYYCWNCQIHFDPETGWTGFLEGRVGETVKLRKKLFETQEKLREAQTKRREAEELVNTILEAVENLIQPARIVRPHGADGFARLNESIRKLVREFRSSS